MEVKLLIFALMLISSANCVNSQFFEESVPLPYEDDGEAQFIGKFLIDSYWADSYIPQIIGSNLFNGEDCKYNRHNCSHLKQ